MNDNIILRLIDMPLTIKGFVMPSDDGTYNIYVNSRYCNGMTERTIMHEIRHIINEDFTNEKSIDLIEKIADGLNFDGRQAV